MSIFKKLVILLVISFVLMSLLSYKTNDINDEKTILLYKERYKKNANDILSFLMLDDTKSLLERLKIMGFSIVDKPKDISKYKNIYEQNINLGEMKIYKKGGILYLALEYMGNEIFICDETQISQNREKNILNFMIYADIFLLFVIFAVFIKILIPIKNLAKGIEKFGMGDFSYRLKEGKNGDEIALVISKFNEMANSLEMVNRARMQFLTDISHELRTPISKSKIALSFLEDGKYKNILKNSVTAMDKLTDELLHIERLNSNNVQFEIKEWSIESILLESLSKMIILDEILDVEMKSIFNINADLNYISIAIKNLIDNAIKYNDYQKDSRIYIKSTPNKLCIISSGEKLDKPLEFYTSVFTRDENARSGYGYGLNLVKRVLDKHGFELAYEHINDKNIFCIIFSI
ncbi:histidine kinase dimerization/phospho-acceptor domain-containing protein [Campylobacter fetus]|uniref:histidine kinase n=4 Tax=Campylobacter fetus TaxID=196 RepID=A0A5L8W656_CAMFE|nr:histidine kinase dimerization/phospho-acceptor domain-containing protein [Campylobacter fetus]EAI4414828.1 HAMP domain-containing histidine kinase [Campylobacter fetus]EAI5408476.1 HAMP domain-containing histidine kinase [Campylobacter fetus]EAJ0327222.1 HAMP domain-containing histidine kinase [Campylobacter fetus]EAJ1230538.1 HAMP domain-containing histidine kinase [Campylobacter fetus]EAK0416579.1 HAMP domain-containing histidine kinase [Campylobacter fetus]